MSKRRPARMLGPAKKLTPEVLRANPILGALARERLKQQREARAEAEAGQLPPPIGKGKGRESPGQKGRAPRQKPRKP